MSEPDLLLAFVILLGVAVFAVTFFSRMGFGKVLGLLATGAIVGPWGLGITTKVEAVRHFSEFGVVLLLFIIGLELHPSKFWSMRRAVFGLGTLQIVVTGGGIAGYAWFFEIPWSVAIVMGFGLALSSTAIGLQILTEKGEIASPHGQASFAILLMQDMAVVPLLALVPLMGMSTDGMTQDFGGSALKALGALVGVVVVVRFVMPLVFRFIASGHAREGFPAAVLVVVVGAAWVMEQVHLSMALGAFLTGLLLSDSEYRHQIEAIVEPFRDFFLSLFFVSIGMSVDFGLLVRDGPMVAGHVVGLMSIKAAILFGLALAFGHTRNNALRVALLLPQCGEFGFVLFGVALAAGIMDESLFQTVLLIIAITMVLTPLLGPITARLTAGQQSLSVPGGSPDPEIPKLEAPVLVVGFGRVGEIVATLLRNCEIPYMALDHNQKKVTDGRARGYQVFFGNASNADVLSAAGAGKAKLAVITVDEPHAAEKAVAAIRFLNPALPIHARAHDQAHSNVLNKAGATSTVLMAMETSLQLGKLALTSAGVSIDSVDKLLEDIRSERTKPASQK